MAHYFTYFPQMLYDAVQDGTTSPVLVTNILRRVKVKDSIKIQKGEQLYISSEKKGKNVIPISEGVKFQTVKKGAKILVDDGKISLDVEKLLSFLSAEFKN